MKSDKPQQANIWPFFKKPFGIPSGISIYALHTPGRALQRELYQGILRRGKFTEV
jgi:hypothetical protein